MSRNKAGFGLLGCGLLLLLLAALALQGCTTETEGYCDDDTDCPSGQRCSPEKGRCEEVSPDGGVDVSPAALDGLPDSDNRGDLGPAATDQGPGGDAAPKAQNGTPCTGAAQCASGHCVDGVCCDGACEGSCRSCALPGEVGACRLAPKGQDPDDDCKGSDPACDGTCDGAGKCGFPGAKTSCGPPTCSAGELTHKTCDGSGGCAIKKESCGGFACDGAACKTTCASKADCAGTFECLGGVCASPQPLGAACGQNDKACQSGLCRDGVCCDSDCKNICMTCALAGKKGTCSPRPDGTACGATTCSGTTKTVKTCKSGACTAVKSDCSPFLCDAKGTDCLAACAADAQCVAGTFCNGSKLCQPKKANGLGCGGDNECTSSLCELGTCCAGACGPAAACVDGAASSTATFKSCASGTCKTTQKGCGTYKCNAQKTDCLTSCTADSQCVTNQFCIAGKCQKKPDGQSCTAAVQCQSGSCVEGPNKAKVCCDKPCKDGPCQSCHLPGKVGTCSLMPAKTPCPTGANKKCVNAATSSYLTEDFCPGNLATCKPEPATICDPYTCAGTACRTSCAVHGDCSSTVCDQSSMFGTQSTCIAATSICYAEAGSPPPGAGTRKSPYTKIQDCLDKTTKLHVAIADGTYNENITIARQAALWGTGLTAGAPIKAVIQDAAKRVIVVESKTAPKVLLWGLKITRPQPGTAVDLVQVYDGNNEILFRSCDIEGTNKWCLYDYSGASYPQLVFEDVSLGKCHGIAVNNADLVMRGCRITGVTSGYAVTHIKGDLVMEDVHILKSGSASSPLAGGIYAAGSDLDLDRVRVGSSFLDKGIELVNQSKGVISNAQISGAGVGLSADNNGEANVIVVNATLVDNTTAQATCTDSLWPRIWFYNCILWKHYPPPPPWLIVGNSWSGKCGFDHSQVQAAASSTVPGFDNASTDPLFNAADPTDPYYHLQPGSPCKDQGLTSHPAITTFPTKDLVGNPRLKGASVDRGALEIQ